MKLSLRPELLRKIFRAAAAMVGLVLVGVGVYLYLRYSDLIVGNIKLETAPSLLMKLETKKLEAALQHYKERREPPAYGEDVKNPFKP